MLAQTIRRLAPAAVLFTVVSIVPSLWADAADNAKPYTIKNGVVDPQTFTGYLHYEGTCYWCHGQDATGSTFAPSLVDALKTLSHTSSTTSSSMGVSSMVARSATARPMFS